MSRPSSNELVDTTVSLVYVSSVFFSVLEPSRPSCNELNDTAGIFNLLLSFGADVTRLNDDWDVNATLAQ